MKVGLWCAVSSLAQAEDLRASLPEQERQGRQWAEGNGHTVSKIFRVPGHSRDYYSLHELVAVAEKRGITAFTELASELDTPTLDALWVRDGDRFARTQALFSYIVERLIAVGVRIYSNADGWVDTHNYRMWISMIGYRAAADIDTLKARHEMGMRQRAKRGLPVSPHKPLSHVVVGNGNEARLALDAAQLPMLLAAGELAAAGRGWQYIEADLYAMGFARRDGKQLTQGLIYHLLHNPLTWGNIARGWTHVDGKRLSVRQYAGEWIFAPADDLPLHVAQVEYGVAPPVYTGDLAERIKARLRQDTTRRGWARHIPRKRYTSLIYCAECGYQMSYQRDALKCFTKWKWRGSGITCTQTARLLECNVDTLMQRLVQEYVEQAPDSLFAPAPDKLGTDTQVAELGRQIETLALEIRGMMRDRAIAESEEVRNTYGQEIERAVERKARLELLFAQRQQTANRQRATRAGEDALRDHIRALTLERFWGREPSVVNRDLLAMMGERVLLARDGEIVGAGDRPFFTPRL